MNYTPPEPLHAMQWQHNMFTEQQLRDEVAKAHRQAIEECAAECLSQHANGNYKHDTREDCFEAVQALAALQEQARDQQGPIKTWQERIEETCPSLGPMHIHASVEEVNDAMQAEIDDLRAAMQAREGEVEQEPIARIMFNDDGRKTDNLIDCDLPVGTLLYAAPQPAQPESIECDCGRIHKKTRYGWACSEPAQPEQGERAAQKAELLKNLTQWLDGLGGAIHTYSLRGIALHGFEKGWDAALQSAQPVAQPLTDEQIDAFWNQQLTVPQIVQRRVIARAIEAAHGIGGAL